MNLGLIITMRSPALRPTETSTTNARSGTPICGAASPTPGAPYMVSIMSSISRSTSPSIAAMSEAG